mmetsp:Transcript_332/g.657  ORF Transcript_332/g.657 Transcript_332/m.657 type:complete len:325 (-) Transcript_332:189-1163(-)
MLTLSFTILPSLSVNYYLHSQHGWCGTTPEHCDEITFQPTDVPSVSPSIPPITSEPTLSPTTGAPSTAPTDTDWSQLTPGHIKFCGPKVVGGFVIAVSTCSPQTECGKGAGTPTAYGYTGNDCPKNSMCYAGINCVIPSHVPSEVPSETPSKSSMPTIRASGVPSMNPTMSDMPTPRGQTKDPTMKPTVSPRLTESPTKRRAPTVPPYNLQNSITQRGSYCGASFQVALNTCSPSTSCSADDDCEKECFPNISCTFHASEANGSTPTGGIIDKEEEEEIDGNDVSGFEFGGNKLGDEYVNSSEVKMCGWAGMMTMSVFLGTMLI